jgi:poly(3-hydroxybutyrate) depolymerase
MTLGLGRWFAVRLLLILLFACAPTREAPSRTQTSAPPEPQPERSASSVPPPCSDAHVEDGGHCYAPPPGPPRGTLIFAHGLFFGDGELDTRARVIERAHADGFGVLVVQGERGHCDWDPSMRDAVCWPIEARQRGRLRELAATWPLDALPRPRVALGYSNGAFAVAALASERIVELEGWAVVGGGLRGELGANPSPAPWLLVAGEDDPHHRQTMDALHRALLDAGRSHEHVSRPGGHALVDADVDRALTLVGR